MIDFLLTVVFIVLFFKALKLLFKITWGIAKISAIILLVLSLPALVLCLIFAGSVALLIPIAIVAAVVGIIKLFA